MENQNLVDTEECELVHSDAEVRKTKKLGLASHASRTSGAEKKHLVNPHHTASLYEGVFSQISAISPLNSDSETMSPYRGNRKDLALNGLSAGQGKTKPSPAKNLPIYEEEDFDNPIQKSANVIHSTKWEDLGITPLLKTDLYKDILETNTELRSEEQIQEEVQDSTSPAIKTSNNISDVKENNNESTETQIFSSWDNVSSASFVNDLYDDIETKIILPNEDTEKFISPKNESYTSIKNCESTKHVSNSEPNECGLSVHLSLVPQSPVGVISDSQVHQEECVTSSGLVSDAEFLQTKTDLDNSSSNIKSQDENESVDDYLKTNDIDEMPVLIENEKCVTDTTANVLNYTQITDTSKNHEDSKLNSINPILNIFVGDSKTIDSTMPPVLEMIASEGSHFHKSLSDETIEKELLQDKVELSELVESRISDQQTVLPQEEIVNMNLTSENLRYLSKKTIEDEVEPPPKLVDQGFENPNNAFETQCPILLLPTESTSAIVSRTDEVHQITQNILVSEMSPPTLCDSRTVVSLPVDMQSSSILPLDVRNANILQNVPSDAEFVQLDLTYMNSDLIAMPDIQDLDSNQQCEDIKPLECQLKTEEQNHILQTSEVIFEDIKEKREPEILASIEKVEPETEPSPEIKETELIVSHEKKRTNIIGSSEKVKTEEVLSPRIAQNHSIPDIPIVASNFDIVDEEIETEVVLSHSHEEVIQVISENTLESCLEPSILSQSERFYRKYIPGKRMPTNPVYDLPETAVSDSSENELQNSDNSENFHFSKRLKENFHMNNKIKMESNTISISSETNTLTEYSQELECASSQNFAENGCVVESSSLKNISDESQTSDSSSLISQKENAQTTDKIKFQLRDDSEAQASLGENSEGSETKERSLKSEHIVKRKYKKSSSGTLHGSSSEGSGSPANEDQPVRRSSRIRSLEEKREKQREFNRKKDSSFKHKKHPAFKKMSSSSSSSSNSSELHPIPEDINRVSEASNCISADENTKNDSNFYARTNSKTSPFLDASCISPITDPRRNANDDDSRRPEKVKSRWRRSSEMERGHSNTPLGLPLKVLNNNSNSQAQNLSDQVEQMQSSDAYQVIKDETKYERERMPNFETIHDNIYLFERKKSKSKKEVRRMVCDCNLTKEEKEEGYLGCLDDCLNRLLMIECGSRCTLGELCANKRFMKRQYAKSGAFKTEKKGWGLKALETMESGTFIMEYVGEVLSTQEFKQRVKQYARDKIDHYYFMALKGDEIIDATLKGNISRFINHSCDPNCETQKWTVNGELRIGFFTRKDVGADEELTFDYQFQRYGREAQKCYCEASNCRGYIGEERKMSLEKPGKTILAPKKKRVVEEKKKDELEDLTLEKELEKLTSDGGLKNREQTLMLNRLMVRAEAREMRQRMLDIIQSTSEQACLRLFVDYHGLTLLWSWMVDLGDDAVELKKQILEILTLLPISNKTILLDSKVMSVVQKWAIPIENAPDKTERTESDDLVNELKECADAVLTSGSPSGNETPVLNENNIDSSQSKEIAETLPSKEPSDFEEEIPAKKIKLESDVSINDQEEEKLSSPVLENLSNWPSIDDDFMELEDVCLSDIVVGQTIKKLVNDVCKLFEENSTSEFSVECGETHFSKNSEVSETSEEPKKHIDIPSLATALLESWSSLKEIFRIPRLEHQKRKQDELEASSVLQERGRDKDYYGSPSRRRDYERDYTSTRSRDYDRSRGYDRSRDRSPRCRDDDDRRRSYDDAHDSFKSKKFVPPISTGPKLTKEERRQLFELEVQQRDQAEALRRQQEYLAQIQAAELSVVPQQFMIPTVYDTGETPCGPHPDYIGESEYVMQTDYLVEFPGQIDYISSEYIGPSEFVEMSDYIGPPPDYATESYVFDPTTGTYHYETSPNYNEAPPGVEFPEPPPALIPVYPPPSGCPDLVSFISTVVSSNNISSNSTPDDLDEYEEEELAQRPVQPIKPSLLRPTASSPAPKPISPYPSPIEGQSPVEVLSPEGEEDQNTNELPSPSEIPLPADINSPSQIPLPTSPAPKEEVAAEITSPCLGSPLPEKLPYLPRIQEHTLFMPDSSEHKTYQPPDQPNYVSPESLVFAPINPSALTSPQPNSFVSLESTAFTSQSLTLDSPKSDAFVSHESNSNLPSKFVAVVSTKLSTSSSPEQSSLTSPEQETCSSPEPPSFSPVGDVSSHSEEIHSEGISSPTRIASPLQSASLPRPIPSTTPLMSLLQLPQLSKLSTPSESSPTPENSPVATDENSFTVMLPSPMPTSFSFDQPALIQSLLHRVTAESSPASPLQVTLPVVNAAHASSTQQITSPVPGILSPALNQPNSISTSNSFVSGQTPFLPVNPQGGPLYYVQPSGAVVPITEQSLAAVPGAVPMVHVAMAPQALEETLPSQPAKPKRLKLPPNWKTAKDGEGNIYYYHSVTRQTQWDPPPGTIEEDELSMDADTPTYEETTTTTSTTSSSSRHSRRRTTTAAADTSSELAKRLKEIFRTKMSSYIVQCLNPYRKPECKVGRITNTDDFKHLARKLTHFVMAKELKHCKNVEDLECNENVKHKAKDFVHKYMGKFGSEYKKEKTLSPRDF